jgi:hypothetical protein
MPLFFSAYAGLPKAHQHNTTGNIMSPFSDYRTNKRRRKRLSSAEYCQLQPTKTYFEEQKARFKNNKVAGI